MQIIFQENKASEKDIIVHLEAVSSLFSPALSDRVNIETYSKKIRKNALTFEAWHHDKVIGLIACYLNIEQNEIFITNVSLLKDYQGLGVAKQLMTNILNCPNVRRYRLIRLKVYDDNDRAISFYNKNGFVLLNKENHQYEMILPLNI